MRPLLLTVATLLLTPAVGAQSVLVAAGGPGSDIGQKVAVDALGRTADVGDFEQTATFGALTVTSADAPAARSDVFVAFYASPSAGFQPLWVRRMGTGVFNDFAGDVAIDPGTNDVLVSGYFTGIATFDGGANPALSLTTRNDFDAFLARYTQAGDLLWVVQGGGPEQDTGRGVVVDASGDAWWTGSFTGAATFGAGASAVTLMSRGSSDGFVARIARDGTLRWAVALGGADSDDARDVALFPLAAPGVPAAEAYVVGTFRGVSFFGTAVRQSRGLSDVYVARLDGAGQTTWAEPIGGAGNDYGRAVSFGLGAVAPSSVFVTGSFEETILVGQDVLTSAGFSDVLVAALAPGTGAQQRGLRGGGTGFDIGNDVSGAGGAFGDVVLPIAYVTGTTNGDATFTSSDGNAPVTLAGRGFDDGFLVSWLPQLPYSNVRVHGIGGANADRGYGVAAGSLSDSFGRTLTLTGVFRDQVEAGGLTAPGISGNDVYLAHLEDCGVVMCPVAGETPPEAETARLSVSPNPSRRPVVTLRLAAPAEAAVEIVDALGRVVAVLHRGALPQGKTRLAPEALPPGAYVVRARGAGVAARQAFVVVR